MKMIYFFLLFFITSFTTIYLHTRYVCMVIVTGDLLLSLHVLLFIAFELINLLRRVFSPLYLFFFLAVAAILLK